jgi:peptidylprolyl isomerase
VSDRGRVRLRRAEPDWQNMTKAERRAAAKAAAARAAAARRRQRIFNWVLAGVAVVALVVGAAWAMGVFGRSDNRPSAEASATPSATVNASFPPLPEGADPALKTKPTTSAGTGELTKLNVTTLIDGTGPAVQTGQNVTVNYVGVSYKTGAEFDSSWKNGKVFSFRIGTGGVIKGWDQGLVGVKVGSRVQLDIPSDLAYGDNGNPAGPLRFIVDVLGAE